MVMILILNLAQESSVVMTLMKVSIGYSRCDQKWFAMFHSKASTRVQYNVCRLPENASKTGRIAPFLADS